tara:strand:- start:360 stop:671 length:312 start_codon:yes stop_codon:yes gene_type:complete
MFTHKQSPSPKNWKLMTDNQKRESINRCLKEKKVINLSLESFSDDGQIVFKIIENIAVNKRGLFLIEFESFLKNEIDKSLTIWCSAQGDKSKLRNLRGVEIKI